MPLQFNDTTNKLGVVQEVYAITGADTVSYPVADVARRVNTGLDRYFEVALSVDNVHQLDDKNFTDLGIATFNLVASQRDYKFTEDDDGNEIVKVHKLFIKQSSSGDYVEIDHVDEEDQDARDLLLNNSSAPTGIPYQYNWFGNSVFFHPIPSYSATNGVKLIFQRTGSYFTASDTTKEPGIPGPHHAYLARLASLPYLVEKQIPSKNDIAELIKQDEEIIRVYYQRRHKDVGNHGLRMAQKRFK